LLPPTSKPSVLKALRSMVLLCPPTQAA
jgi:hypothetical protein